MTVLRALWHTLTPFLDSWRYKRSDCVHCDCPTWSPCWRSWDGVWLDFVIWVRSTICWLRGYHTVAERDKNWCTMCWLVGVKQ